MFDHLADPSPPGPGRDERDAVALRVQMLRRRRTRRRLEVACLLATAVVVAVVAVAQRSDPQHVATASGSQPPDGTRHGPLSPGEAEQQCFAPHTDAHQGGSAPTLTNWPAGLPSLLAVDGQGRLWVVRDGAAAEWTQGVEGAAAIGIRWARWAPDGSIYASRLIDSPAVEIDRFEGPGTATKAFELPFTVSQTAPAGTCPIDGDMDTFTLGSDGFVFAHHVPGPIPHSCPAGAPQSSCVSAEGTTFEKRSLAGDSSGDLGDFAGARETMGGENADGSWIIQKRDGGADVEHLGGTPQCCFGGLPGQAFALSPDGSQLAAADGATVSVGHTDPSGPSSVLFVDQQPLGTAMAWTGQTLAVARGDRLALLSTMSGIRTIIDGFTVGSVICLDFAS